MSKAIFFTRKQESQDVEYYVNETQNERHYPMSCIVVLKATTGEDFFIEYNGEDFILALGVTGDYESLARLLTESGKDIIRKGYGKGHVTVIDTTKGAKNHE